jgi:phage terminase large subunit-like protein
MDNMSLEQKRQVVLALKRKEALALHQCFNPRDTGSKPTKVQRKILDAINSVSERYVLGGNQSGKSNLGGREASWLLQGEHPGWKNKPDHPLLMLVIGQTHKIVKEELWEAKIKPFLRDGSYKVFKEGSALTSVVHENGNRILFFSHKSPEECRQAVQAFVADWVWLDEMPSSYKLLTELHTRCQANSAPFLATFTPLLRNAEIKNHIENGNSRLIKKYFLKTYDNPVYTKDQLKDMKEKHSLMSEAERDTRTVGAWYQGDNAVYDFSADKHCEAPPGYHPSWRHLESVDPAAAGKAGYALLAEDPSTHIWYLIKDDYIEGKAPSELLDAVTKLSENVNCVKKVSDSHETWFIKEAALHKIWYAIPHKKTERKKELIKNLQEAIHQGKFKVAPWCKLAIDEFITCQWAESGDRIVNSRHYHILDCLQYAIDTLPPKVKIPIVQTIHQIMKEKDQKRRAAEAESRRKPAGAFARIMPRKRSRWGRR